MWLTLFLRVLSALSWLVPCPLSSASCPFAHVRIAEAIATVALADRHPLTAVRLLLAGCAHETACRLIQQRGGPAVGPWSVEVPARERDALRADLVAAATLALRRARTCGGSWRGYSGGRCDGLDARHERSAAELRRTERSAGWALAAQSSSGQK